MGTKIQNSNFINNQVLKYETCSAPLKNETSSIFSVEKNQKTQNEEKNRRKKILIGVSVGIAAVAGTALFISCKNGSIKNLFKETKLGQLVEEGLSNAKEAKKVSLEPVTQEKTGLLEKLVNKFAPKTDDIAKNIISDTDFIEKGVLYTKGRIAQNPNIVAEMTSSVSTTDAIKSSIELSGTGPTKIAQILSNDAEIMSKLDDKLPNFAEALRKTKTECNPSRSLDEAMKFLQESFPDSGYVIEKNLGVGSIGATYLARTPTGETVAIKMIKKGVSLESLQAEENLLTDTISKICSGEELDKAKTLIKDLYKGWGKELNLTQSLEYNKAFSNSATRYSVAQIKEISKNGQCLVMEMADGIQMNKLMKILQDYKANPANFTSKYADLIKKYPWLSDPDKVLSELPKTITKSFSEQFLFLKEGGNSIMHGDPHTGNFFITAKNGKIIPKFIDTDNCVVRTAEQIKNDISMFTNYFVGNSKKIAEYYVNQCSCIPSDKAKYIELISEELKKTIFNRKCNITNYTRVQDIINAILKKHGLSLSVENSTALKSQLQFIKVIGETNRLSEKRLDILTLIKDIPQAVWCMIKSKVNPFNCIKDALIYSLKNPVNAISNAGQFFV